MSLIPSTGLLRSLAQVSFILFAILVSSVAWGAEQLDSAMSVLVKEIAAIPNYTATKEQRLEALRQAYSEAQTADAKFAHARELFDEYVYYQSDSAYAYATRMKLIAEGAGDRARLALAHIALMKCFTSNGYFKEAADMNALIDTTSLEPAALLDYLNTGIVLYRNLESYVGGSSTDLGTQYQSTRLDLTRKLSELADSTTYLWRQNKINLDLTQNPSASKEIAARREIIRRFNLGDHEKAIQYSLLGHASLYAGDRDGAKFYLIMSAIHDIRGSIHETTAAKMLAELMYEDSDNLNMAHVLVHRAFDDATFYNSHLRRDELSRTMQMIDSARFRWRSNQLWLMVAVLITILILGGVATVLFVKVRHRNRLIEKVNQELNEKSVALDKTSHEVEAVNRALEATIAQLKEVSEIKDRYITQSLYLNTVFVNQVEDRCKEVVKLLKEKKYDELKFLPYQMGIKEERQRIFRSFDHAFLQLFPNFIEEFNKLFDEADHVVLGDDNEIPMDVRIFALLRLGISDPTEVARYLNLSTKTVYVYKTRIKSRAKVDNSDFETRVVAIPKP